MMVGPVTDMIPAGSGQRAGREKQMFDLSLALAPGWPGALMGWQQPAS